LEEAQKADLLAIVVDSSDEYWREQMSVVEKVLQEMKADKAQRLVVFNKADKAPEADRNRWKKEGRIAISAKTRAGLPEFLARIEEELEKSLPAGDVMIPHDRQDLLPFLHRSAHILSETPGQEGTVYRVAMAAQNWGQINSALKKNGKQKK
jgi:GTP-binding protein HflX